MNTIIRDKRILAPTRLFMLYLLEVQENGQVIKDKQEMATELGTTRQAIIRYVKELTENNYIKEEREFSNKPSVIKIL